MTKLKIALLLTLSIFILSCNQSGNNSSSNNNLVVIKKAEAQNTIEGTLKASTEYDIQFNEQVPLTDKAYFTAKHKDEIIKTIEVVEKDTIPSKDFILVFYRYSVGADIVHKTTYMKQMEGKWYVHPAYFGSYEDDPFKNGKGVEGKALLDKSDKWEKEDENIWWK